MKKYISYIIIFVLLIPIFLHSQTPYFPWESFELKETNAEWIQRELDTSLFIEGESNGSSHILPFNYVPPQIKDNYIHSIHWANVTDYDGWFYEKIDLESGEVIERNTFDFRDQSEPYHHHVPMAFYMDNENEPVIISLRNIEAYDSTGQGYFIAGAVNHLSKQKLSQDSIQNIHVNDKDSMAKLLYFPYGPARLYYPKNDNITYATNFSWQVVNQTPTLSYVRESYNDSGYITSQTDSLYVPVPDSAYGGVEIAHRSQIFLDNGYSLLSAGIHHRDAPENSVMHVFYVDNNWKVLGEFDLTPFFKEYNNYTIIGADNSKMTFKNRENFGGDRSSYSIVTVDLDGNLIEKINGFADGESNYSFFPRHVYSPEGDDGIFLLGTSTNRNSIDIWKTNGMGEAELAERIQAKNPKMSITPISIQFTEDEDLLLRVNVTKDTLVNGNSMTWGRWNYMMLIDREELGITTDVVDIKNDKVEYQVYPNPTQNTLHFDWQKDQLPLMKNIDIRSLNGKIVHDQRLNPYQSSMDINLSSGLYMLNVYGLNGDYYQSKRIIVID